MNAGQQLTEYSTQPSTQHPTEAPPNTWIARRWRLIWLIASLALYLGLAAYQLGLPGLHYDEAREAGLNALELLTGAPVTAFREATVSLFGLPAPLMVQDYIGALNVWLAWPVLAITGVGVPDLRFVGLLAGLAALLMLERTVSEWMVLQSSRFTPRTHERSIEDKAPPSFWTPISLAGLFSVTLLAASPSFVFWSRQGIFVTNLTQPLTLLCIWLGLHWLRTGRKWALPASAFAGGLALYAKLLAIWIIGPFVLLAGGWWCWRRMRGDQSLPRLSIGLAALMIGAFALPLVPLLLFNLKTGGTFQTIVGNASESYYGVDNRRILDNLPVRLGQLVKTLRGDHFWYLGGLHANLLAPWLAAGTVLFGLARRRQALLGPILLVILAVAMSLFTVSDLFLTHYALIQPYVAGVVGIALGSICLYRGRGQPHSPGSARQSYVGVTIVLTLWLLFDLTATLQTHQSLERSGGLAGHSDAAYHLAYHLRYNGLGAPIALDWGFDATVRYLTENTVTPIEIFGYSSPAEPDPDFAARLDMFIHNPDNVYLLHASDQTAFAGRRDVFFQIAEANGLTPLLEATFSERNGTELVELWRLQP